MPDLETLLSAADIYFQYCHNQPYSLFHEASFRQRLRKGEIPKHLAFAFLATTIRFSADPRYQHNKYEAISAYAAESWKAIVLPWNGVDTAAGVSILQAIFLLSVIDYTGGKCQAGWIKVGLAIRIAYYLRLMIEPDPSFSPIEQEERRRVFWSFYVLDKLISCGRERPPAMLDEDCKLQLPGDERSFRDGSRQQSPTLDQFASESSSTPSLLPGNTFALLVLMSSVFGKCAQYTLQEHKYPTQGTPWDPRSPFSSIYCTLLQMESDFGLGDPLTGKIQQDFVTDGVVNQQATGPLVYAHCLFHLCQCLLHHPFLLRQRLAKLKVRAPASFLIRVVDSCKAHAIALTNLLEEVKSAGFKTIASFYGYYNYLPGTIHALFLNSEDIATREAAENAYAACLRNLHELSYHWKHAELMVCHFQSCNFSFSRPSSL